MKKIDKIGFFTITEMELFGKKMCILIMLVSHIHIIIKIAER